MNCAIAGLVLFIGVILTEVVIAGPLEDATAAYSRSDYPTAFRIWSALADQGDATAQANLGIMYRDGRGVAKDDAQAVQWYRKAAEQGNAFGQTNLGVMYRDGRGVAKDDAQAVEWFRQAAEQGFAPGQNNLGYMYQTGRGIAKDDALAVEWYRKAAEQGNAQAQTNLGIMYRDGRGVAKDDAEAKRWLRKAAAQGDKRAQATKVSGSAPAFPREAIRAGIRNGHVVAQVLIDETGNVNGVTIVKADPPGVFDRVVVEALSQWKFVGDGNQYKHEVQIKFELKDE